MCMNLLGMLADAKLPLTITDKALIDRLRMLDAMGYVKAFIPAVHVDCDNCARQDPAIALEVTPRGRKALSDEQSLEAAQVQRPAQMLPQGERRAAPIWPGGTAAGDFDPALDERQWTARASRSPLDSAQGICRV